jgi:hypothetical protein
MIFDPFYNLCPQHMFHEKKAARVAAVDFIDWLVLINECYLLKGRRTIPRGHFMLNFNSSERIQYKSLD